MVAAHPLVTLVKQISRGGWSSGSRTEVYTESIPAPSFPGLLAILGWRDPHAIVYPPRLECLTAVDHFIEKVLFSPCPA
jgi:hypothetical protein